MNEDHYRPRDSEAGPLAGIKVLDLTIARAGPTCTRQLSDLGADVVRLSAPGRGDLGGSDAQNLTRDKRSVVIDLKHPDGHAAFMRLAAAADVLVENFRAPVKTKLGIDYETLAPLYPRLVYASVSGFGQSGPYRERPGVDQIAQGMGGLMSVTGPPGTGPWRAGIAISDTAAGTFLTQGVLAALFARERTGRGQWVHTSLLESMVAFMDFQAARWLIDGVVPEQTGNDHPTLVPMGAFETADGMINVAVLGHWDVFVTVLDDANVRDDPRFTDPIQRVVHRDALRAAIGARLRARSSADWLAAFVEAGIPCGPVNRMDDVFADPQVEHLALTRSVRGPKGRTLEVLRHPVTLSETPTAIKRPPAAPGEHTREVLAAHGFTDAEIDGLCAAGAVAEAPPRGGA